MYELGLQQSGRSRLELADGREDISAPGQINDLNVRPIDMHQRRPASP